MVRYTGHFVRILIPTVLILVSTAGRASAQGVGFQVGGSIDPEQFFLGSQYETPALIDRLHFRPGIDGGFGNGLRLATINIDFIYKIPISGSAWTIYQGSGPIISIARITDDRVRSETDVSAGLGAVFGFAHDSGFFTELRVGGFGGPNLKFGAGFILRTR